VEAGKKTNHNKKQIVITKKQVIGWVKIVVRKGTGQSVKEAVVAYLNSLRSFLVCFFGMKGHLIIGLVMRS